MTASAMDPTDITAAAVLAAIAAGAHTVFDIASRLGVPHTSATLRHLLHDMVRDGVLVADDSDTRHFAIA
jgi:DNA-binding IclR family transcriptional regulator